MGHCSSNPLGFFSKRRKPHRVWKTGVRSVKERMHRVNCRPRLSKNLTIEAVTNLALEIKSRLVLKNDEEKTAKCWFLRDLFTKLSSHPSPHCEDRERSRAHKLDYATWLNTFCAEVPMSNFKSQSMSPLNGLSQNNYPQRPLAIYIHLATTCVTQEDDLPSLPSRYRSIGFGPSANRNHLEIGNDHELSVRISQETTPRSSDYLNECLSDVLDLIDAMQPSPDPSDTFQESLLSYNLGFYQMRRTVKNSSESPWKQESIPSTEAPPTNVETCRRQASGLDSIYYRAHASECCTNKRASSQFGVARLLLLSPCVPEAVPLNESFKKWLTACVERHFNDRDSITNHLESFFHL